MCADCCHIINCLYHDSFVIAKKLHKRRLPVGISDRLDHCQKKGFKNRTNLVLKYTPASQKTEVSKNCLTNDINIITHIFLAVS